MWKEQNSFLYYVLCYVCFWYFSVNVLWKYYSWIILSKVRNFVHVVLISCRQELKIIVLSLPHYLGRPSCFGRLLILLSQLNWFFFKIGDQNWKRKNNSSFSMVIKSKTSIYATWFDICWNKILKKTIKAFEKTS